MGKMKDWGIQVADLVYFKHLKDEEILEQMKIPKEQREWAIQQIKSIRENPNLWRPLANRYG